VVVPSGLAPPPVAGTAELAALGAGGNVLVVKPGMTMAEIERGAIESALRETRGNRRKAAEVLAIGERTLYRKLKEYNLPLGSVDSDN
jgi:DNA-binding NtrC family response regulator